tara:strand:- start:2134 stop:3267 length:1134 start_codon:yes stop_codon:yes gene_type:complete
MKRVLKGFMSFSIGHPHFLANNPSTLYAGLIFENKTSFKMQYNDAFIWYWNESLLNIGSDLAYISATPYLYANGNLTPFCSVGDPINDAQIEKFDNNTPWVMYVNPKVGNRICNSVSRCIKIPINWWTSSYTSLNQNVTFTAIMRLSEFYNEKLKHKIINWNFPAYWYNFPEVDFSLPKERAKVRFNASEPVDDFNDYIKSIRKKINLKLVDSNQMNYQIADRRRCIIDKNYYPFSPPEPAINYTGKPGCLGDNRDVMYSISNYTQLSNDNIIIIHGVNHNLLNITRYFSIDVNFLFNEILSGSYGISSKLIPSLKYYSYAISSNCTQIPFMCITFTESLLNKYFKLGARYYGDSNKTAGPDKHITPEVIDTFVLKI